MEEPDPGFVCTATIAIYFHIGQVYAASLSIALHSKSELGTVAVIDEVDFLKKETMGRRSQETNPTTSRVIIIHTQLTQYHTIHH